MANFLERLQTVSDTLSPAHKQVGEYIMENYDFVAFYTLQELAAKIGVSTTTVIRFSRELGYQGYAALKQSIQSSVRGKVSLPKRLKITSAPPIRLLKTFQNDAENLKETLKMLDPVVLEKSIQAIVQAEHVYILGLRSSFSLAHFLFVTMGQIKSNVHLLQGTGQAFAEEMLNIREGDVCIAFLFPRYLSVTIELLEEIRGEGAKSIIFTNPFYLPIQEYGDFILPCSVQGVSYKDSFVAPLSLINYIVAQVANLNQEEAAENLQRAEKFFNNSRIFKK